MHSVAGNHEERHIDRFEDLIRIFAYRIELRWDMGAKIQKYKLRITHPSTDNAQFAPDPNFAFPRGGCEGLSRPRTDFIPPVREHKLRTRGAPLRIAFSWPVDFEDAEDHGGGRTCVPLLDQADGGVLA